LKNYEVEGVSSAKFIDTNTRYFRDDVWRVIYFLSQELSEEVC
jgi:hypothetical protein